MGRMASREIMVDFWNDCLSKLDQQTFNLESEEAKKEAIQVVQRVLRDIALSEGDDVALRVIHYPKRIIYPKIY